jgi:hypothetical protein
VVYVERAVDNVGINVLNILSWCFSFTIATLRAVDGNDTTVNIVSLCLKHKGF